MGSLGLRCAGKSLKTITMKTSTGVSAVIVFATAVTGRILLPTNERGQLSEACDRNQECQLVTECLTFQQLMVSPGDREEMLRLRKSICGFEGTLPKICCPKSTILETSTVFQSNAGIEDFGLNVRDGIKGSTDRTPESTSQAVESDLTSTGVECFDEDCDDTNYMDSPEFP